MDMKGDSGSLDYGSYVSGALANNQTVTETFRRFFEAFPLVSQAEAREAGSDEGGSQNRGALRTLEIC